MLAFALTVAVAAVVAFGCYAAYRIECKVVGEKPVKFFGW